MNKSLVLITLFFGAFVSVDKTEAAVSHPNILKGLETTQNSPWDPRNEQKTSSDNNAPDGQPLTEDE